MLDIDNAKVVIRRKNADQKWYYVTGFAEPRRALIRDDKQGTPVTPPWFPSGPDEDKGIYFSMFRLELGGADENPPGYNQRPGDIFLITGTRTLNGTYKQVAEGRTFEGDGLDGYSIPVIKVSTSITGSGTEPGQPGGGDNESRVYVYNQLLAAAQWVITHNLGAEVSVTVLDSNGEEFLAEILHLNLNQIIVNLGVSMSGRALLHY